MTLEETGAAQDEISIFADRSVIYPLFAIGNALVRSFDDALQPLGITFSEYMVLLALWERPDQKLVALMARLQMDQHGLLSLLRTLFAKGLVRMEPECDLERVTFVSLTTVGAQLREHVGLKTSVLNDEFRPEIVADMNRGVRILVEAFAQRETGAGR